MAKRNIVTPAPRGLVVYPHGTGMLPDGVPDRPLDLPERGPNDVPNVYGPVPEVVTEDVYVVRRDLGANVRTFLAAGTRVPPGLEDFPRESA